MSVVIGRFIDKDTPIQSANDPISDNDLARKKYVDDKLALKADLVDGKVPSSQLPSYVDDIIEVADFASLPAEGEIGKIYVTLDTNKIYRWSGSVYVEVSSGPATTDDLPEGSTNLYYTNERAQAVVDAKVPTGPMEIAFGSPDGSTLDRSEFLTYDASIGFFLNVGGVMVTRSLEQNPIDPQSIIDNDKVEVFGDDGTGPAYSRVKKDYIEAKKVEPSRELSASVGYDGVDSWLGVSETTNTGNNISMAKIFPNKAQLFTVDLGLGNGPQPILPVEPYDLAVKKYVDDSVATKQDSLGTGTTAQYLRGDLTWQELSFPVAQVKHVSKNGVDATADGSEEKPYLTIAAAMASITDATPSKRYVIRVAAGSYTESSVSLKANVFVIGESKESVRITGAVSMNADFNQPSSSDCRSGFSMVSLLSACDFNWQTVTSPAGKLYFNEVIFGSTVSLYGHNNAIAQSQFDSCIIFGAMTVSGINVGVYSNCINYSNITLNQHPNGGMATILAASGGYCSGTVKFYTTVSDFNRRCAGFLRAFNCENLIIDGPSSYADCDLVSQGKSSTQKLNGGQLVAFNPRINHDIETQMVKPLSTNAHNSGDWAKQWFFHFAYVHASSGTDLYLTSVMENYNPAGDTTGRSVFIQSDGYGLQSDVNGGNIELETAVVSGTGVRGKVQIKARELDMTSAKITNLADGVNPQDAVTKSQLDAVSGSTGKKESFTLTATDISNQYIDCSFLAKPDTMIFMSGGVVHVEGESYTLSTVGGVTRITFIGDLIEPSATKLLEGDKVHVQYLK